MSLVENSSAMRDRKVALRAVPSEAPWSWLAAGWRDLKRGGWVSLSYGLFFALASAAITLGLWLTDSMQVLPPLAAGFMLVGPLLAVGLYEISRRLEAGKPVSIEAALLSMTRSPVQIGFLGVLLMVCLLFWIRLAFLLFALFLGTGAAPPPEIFVSQLLFTPEGLGLVVVGTLAGALLAFGVYAISVVSVPLLLDRDIDAMTAIIASLKSVRLNWKPLLLWAWLIAIITIAGLATFYVGLIVTFPLIGHATWHAYRDLVEPAAR
jgi:uncharacterized membrane protein